MGKRINHVGSVFIRQILKQMKKVGLNKTRLAERLNVSRPYVVKVLRGDVNITLETAVRFAKAVGMDLALDLSPAKEEPMVMPATTRGGL